jgi:hypothetical protein
MNGSFVRDRDLHCDRAIRGFDHAVTLFFKELPGQVAQVSLILDQQDGLRPRLGGCGFRRNGNLCRTLSLLRNAG